MRRKSVASDVSEAARAGVALLSIFGGLAIGCSPVLAADSYSEDSVKAAYLYRFAGYIDWPADAAAGAPFTIAVLGAPGVAGELQRLLPGHPIKGGIAQVRQIKNAQDVGAAKILYVGKGHADILRSLNSRTILRSILLVTDEEGGLDSGGVLNFLTIDRRVRFEISVNAADRAGLKISSELLSVAVRIHGDRRQTHDSRLPADSRSALAAGTR